MPLLSKPACRVCGDEISKRSLGYVDMAIGAEVELAWYLTTLEALEDLRDERGNLGPEIDAEYLHEVREAALHGAGLIHDLHAAVHGRGAAPPSVVADLLANHWYQPAHSLIMAVRSRTPKAFTRVGMDLFLPPSLPSPAQDSPPLRFKTEAHRMVAGTTFKDGRPVRLDGP